jgi:HSP20 family protein
LVECPRASRRLRHGAHSEEKTERDGYLRQEIVSGNFYRQIPVGEIDPNAVKAQVENGVLTVTLPAPTEPQPVKIAINSGSGSQAA